MDTGKLIFVILLFMIHMSGFKNCCPSCRNHRNVRISGETFNGEQFFYDDSTASDKFSKVFVLGLYYIVTTYTHYMYFNDLLANGCRILICKV